MRILVTGAVGRVGHTVCQVVAEAGHELVASDIRRRPDTDFAVHYADLRSPLECFRVVDGCDAVIHLGNHPGPWVRSAQEVLGDNLQMNVNLFEAARACDLRHVVFASSIQVISGRRSCREEPSELPYLPIDSYTPANPGNAYAISKHLSEQLMIDYARLDREPQTWAALRLPHTYREPFARYTRTRRHYAMLDEAFALLSARDAGRLALAIIDAGRPGYELFQPGCATPSLARPLEELVRDYYPDVELRRPIEELHGLVDLADIAERVDWQPCEDEWPEPLHAAARYE